MAPEIATVLAILAVAVLLFVTEWVRVDVVALLVLVSLAVTVLVTPAEAVSGFSNLAVITVWAVLILSGGLAGMGVAGIIGRPMMRLAGGSDARLIALIMLTVGVLSGFMHDIGVAALMLPVVVDIARRTGRPPSKLLMPLAFAALLGGLNTLIGTPPNPLMMAVAVSASAAFLSPVGHSANVLIMGSGGYRFADHTKVGIPLTLVVLVVVLLVVPIFWPF